MILRRNAAVLAAAFVLLVAAPRLAHATSRLLSVGYSHSQPLPPLENPPPTDAPADDLTMPAYRELPASQLAAGGGGNALHTG